MSGNGTNGLDGLTDKLIAERKAQVAAWKRTAVGSAAIFHANGVITFVEPNDNGVFSYEKLCEIVGGGIEQQRLHDGRWMTINDEALALELPFNVEATALYMDGRDEFTGIHGDVLVCSAEQAGA